jgi:hypothetical protein
VFLNDLLYNFIFFNYFFFFEGGVGGTDVLIRH